MARYLTNQSRARELAQQLAMQERIVARFKGVTARHLSGTMRQVVKQFEQDGTDLSTEAIVKTRQPALANLLAREFRTAADTFGQRLLVGIKSRGGMERKELDPDDIFDQAISRYVRNWSLNAAKDISATTTKQMRGLILGGLDEGLGIAAIAKNINSVIPSISALRANTIARTETHTAANIGAATAAEATGLTLLKEWLASDDDRSRGANERTTWNHRAMDGTTVGMFQKFVVSNDETGETEELEYPGDPSGSAGNIINCRCMVGYLEQ